MSNLLAGAAISMISVGGGLYNAETGHGTGLMVCGMLLAVIAWIIHANPTQGR
ncbi:hypothetical protein LCGC14_0044310 [marine sediment metagenome]|mgnify:CR=1 FL=1|uniref:Uncharacterized protein n=1 Tax=marine sediment metagenome TaxID=412755 RepID=A0A0F9W870_9ZZZZ|nr:hypothetical protein [Sulfitobacter litoralis]